MVFKTGILSLLFSLASFCGHTQEICNNGIDDDGDGKIDLQDESCINGIYNLIANPSFEITTGCPDDWSKLHYALNWQQTHPTAGSADLYHKCGCKYPLAGLTLQAPLPALHGDGFGGFYDTKQYDSYGAYKEFLGTCLTATLKKNTVYKVRFTVGFMHNVSGTNAITSKSPVSISLYGNASCVAIQYSNGFRYCPMTMMGAGWNEMIKMDVAGSPGQWVTAEAEFTSPIDVNGLVIGPSCAPSIHEGQNYYFIDNILIYQKHTYPIPEIERSGDICADTLTLTGKMNPFPANYTCQWYRDGVALSGETANQLKLTRTLYGEGDYTVRFTINGINFLSSDERIEIKDLGFYLDDSVALCNKPVTLAPVLHPLPPGCVVTYLWQDGSAEPTLETNTTGWHWFETNREGCRYRDSVYVFDYTPPAVNLGKDTTLCEGQGLTLIAGNSNAFVYAWQDGASQNTFPVSEAGTYWVNVSNDYCSTRDTIVVQYAKGPDIRFSQDSILCEGEVKQLQPDLYGDAFVWNTGSTEKTISINTPGTYAVTASNQCGTLTRSITIAENNCRFYLPDAFTPNGDGLNDRFGLKEFSFIRQYYIAIYNRWGEIIYRSTNPASQWNGMVNGKAVPTGVYVWLVDYTDWLGRKMRQKGTVVVIR